MPGTVLPNVSTVYKNATGDVAVTKTYNVFNADGSVKNITGYSILLRVWDGDPTQILLSSTNVANDGTPTDGIVIWTVALADLAALPIRPSGLKSALRFYTGPVGAPTYQDTTDPFSLVILASG